VLGKGGWLTELWTKLLLDLSCRSDKNDSVKYNNIIQYGIRCHNYQWHYNTIEHNATNSIDRHIFQFFSHVERIFWGWYIISFVVSKWTVYEQSWKFSQHKRYNIPTSKNSFNMRKKLENVSIDAIGGIVFYCIVMSLVVMTSYPILYYIIVFYWIIFVRPTGQV
jgi:hypothetical protein